VRFPSMEEWESARRTRLVAGGSSDNQSGEDWLPPPTPRRADRRSRFRSPRNDNVLWACGRPPWQASSTRACVPADRDVGQAGRSNSDSLVTTWPSQEGVSTRKSE
jgi:hypothetical protein